MSRTNWSKVSLTIFLLGCVLLTIELLLSFYSGKSYHNSEKIIAQQKSVTITESINFKKSGNPYRVLVPIHCSVSNQVVGCHPPDGSPIGYSLSIKDTSTGVGETKAVTAISVGLNAVDLGTIYIPHDGEYQVILKAFVRPGWDKYQIEDVSLQIRKNSIPVSPELEFLFALIAFSGLAGYIILKSKIYN